MQMKKSTGPYEAGARLTTDPEAPVVGEGNPPYRVDPPRLAAWRKLGIVHEPEENDPEEKAKEKKAARKKSTPKSQKKGGKK